MAEFEADLNDGSMITVKAHKTSVTTSHSAVPVDYERPTKDPRGYREESTLQEFRELCRGQFAVPQNLVKETGTDCLA